ncbi:hypothetical protein FF38_00450 [Lucilia cuprina]|uniref:BHLH domain-containing protein n=1 Tax=Lucilia cuprina TaxID=7375 RepID=A0A0L0BKY6_LUCCU|nr:Protein Fer3 [Lucilia cuprina]KNC20593.1 hypothetical protein FF38_00450 [Lucilia cuprina]
MTDHLEISTLHNETLPPNNAHLVQRITTNADGTANDLRTNYESDNDSDKTVLLELGVSTNVATTMSVPTSVTYSSDYPLDIHLNNVCGISVATHTHPYNTDPTLLYSNPYNDGISSVTTHQTLLYPAHQSSNSSSLISLNNVPYSAHIPQTVQTWPTPKPVTSITSSEINNKLSTQIVPPPVYMSYPDVREHSIIKETNPSWKVKALQSEKDYKKTACDRERTRMRDMNKAFDLLRSKLPISKPNGKKYSKIESLRIAINYINYLQKILKDTNPNSQTAVEYLTDFNSRRRSHHKSNTFDDAEDKLENLEESRSTWSGDGYIANSQDKWE